MFICCAEKWSKSLCVSRFLGSLRTRLTQLHPSANCSLRDDHMVHVHFKEEIGIAELIPLVTTYIILFAYIYFSTREPNASPTFVSSYFITFRLNVPYLFNPWNVQSVNSHASHCAFGRACVRLCVRYVPVWCRDNPHTGTLYTAVRLHPANTSLSCQYKH